jgi:predicted DNA-binding transcriptional regulator AlpA
MSRPRIRGQQPAPGIIEGASSRYSALPPNLPPRGLSRTEAAALIGVSPTTFDKLVADGRMPRPKAIDARRVWDRLKVENAFANLPEGGTQEGVNPWD